MLRVAHRKDPYATAALIDAALKNSSKSSCTKVHSGFSLFFALPQLRSLCIGLSEIIHSQYFLIINFQRGRWNLLRKKLMKQKLMEPLAIPPGRQNTATKWLVIITVALFGAITLPFAAYGETPMELLIVTPTRMPQSLDKTIVDTTVLTEQDIRKSGAPDVPTLLRSLAGVEVVQSGGLGNVSSTFMRGTNSSHVLVLLDGVRINSATTGTTALEHIMLDSIERIEVVRGNVSSLYGSEAIGGVIQLFTRRGKGSPAFNASAGLGSHGTKRLAAGFSGEVNDTSFGMNVGKVKTDGVSAINTQIAPGANPDNDGYDNTTLNAQVKHTFNADHQLSAALFNTHGDSQYDNAYNLATTDLNNTKAAIQKLSLTSDDQLNAMWHSKLNLARGVDDSRDYLNGTEGSRIKTVNKQLAWQNELQIAETQRVNLAAEHLVQSVTSDTLYTQTRRTVNSLLGGYVGEYGAQQVQFNLRQDRYSDFGTANTGLLGYGFSFADSWRATASISNAFKAPTFNDLFYPGYANLDVRPEHANNREVGLRYASDGQRLDLVYFDNRIHDLITYPAPMYVAKNIDRARIDGIELGYTGEFGDTRLKANATWQNPRDTVTGQVLQRRAKKFGSLAASHGFGSWNAGAEIRYSGARRDVDYSTYPSTDVSLPAYQVINLTSGYTIDKNFNLSLRVDNLFNRNYSEAYSYNTLGRTLFVGLNYQQ
jgi:vitamin B12 transporter